MLVEPVGGWAHWIAVLLDIALLLLLGDLRWLSLSNLLLGPVALFDESASDLLIRLAFLAHLFFDAMHLLNAAQILPTQFFEALLFGIVLWRSRLRFGFGFGFGRAPV